MLKEIAAGVAAVVLVCVVSPSLAADGQPDPAFGTAGVAYVTYDSADGNQLRDNTMVVLPDGRLLFGERATRSFPAARIRTCARCWRG